MELAYTHLLLNLSFPMKKTILFTILLFTSSYTFSQADNKLELLDIFNLEFISDPQISPDGKQIIYTRNFKDVMTDKNHSNLWSSNFDGSKLCPQMVTRWQQSGLFV